MILTHGTWALMWSKVEICLSCAYISQTFSSYFQVVPCLVWSETLHTECFIEIFLMVSCVLQYFCPDKPYDRTCCGSVHFIAVERSIRDLRKCSSLTPHAPVWEMKTESCSSVTSVFWLLFYYLDISELMWAMIWEFPGAARLQLFPLYHLRFSSTGFYYRPIGNLRTAIYSEQIDGVLDLVVSRMYIQSYFSACIRSW